MYLTARKLALVGALIVVMIGFAVPAYADPGDFVNCEQSPTSPECVLDPSTPAKGGSDGGQGGGAAGCLLPSDGSQVPCYLAEYGFYGGDGCWYQVMTADEVAHWGLVEPAPPGRYYQGTCLDAGLNPIGTRFTVFTNQPGAAVLAEQAIKRLRLPSPVIKVNPLVTVDPAEPPAQVVYVPTWLWVDPGSWGTRSATASAGGLSVTATAKPTQVEWSTGDGRTETCNGPGKAWTPGTDPSKASTCGHTYTTPSPKDGKYTLRATVTWEISWAGGGESGTRPALTTTSEMALQVLQAGALNSNGAAR